MAGFQFTRENAAKVTDFTRFKAAARVVTQTPDPGTPVLEGMTIEVHAVSYSDIPWVTLDPNAIAGIRNIPIADIEKVIADDNVLRSAAGSGVVVNEADFNTRFSQGLAAHGFTVQFTTGQGNALAKSFNQFGFK